MKQLPMTLTQVLSRMLGEEPVKVAPGQYAVLRALQPRGGTEKDIDALVDRVAAQALVIQALVSYLETSPGFDGARFAGILHDIDALDGVVDGKIGSRRINKPEPKQAKSLPKAR